MYIYLHTYELYVYIYIYIFKGQLDGAPLRRGLAERPAGEHERQHQERGGNMG